MLEPKIKIQYLLSVSNNRSFPFTQKLETNGGFPVEQVWMCYAFSNKEGE